MAIKPLKEKKHRAGSVFKKRKTEKTASFVLICRWWPEGWLWRKLGGQILLRQSHQTSIHKKGTPSELYCFLLPISDQSCRHQRMPAFEKILELQCCFLSVCRCISFWWPSCWWQQLLLHFSCSSKWISSIFKASVCLSAPDKLPLFLWQNEASILTKAHWAWPIAVRSDQQMTVNLEEGCTKQITFSLCSMPTKRWVRSNQWFYWVS